MINGAVIGLATALGYDASALCCHSRATSVCPDIGTNRVSTV